MYQKEIIYIGLYKDGTRIGNAGFLKVENREQESRLGLQLKNIPFNIKGRFPIRIYNGNDWKEINGVSVQEGGGSWEDNVEDDMQQVQIQVMLPGGYFLEGRSKNASVAFAQVKPEKENVPRPDSKQEEQRSDAARNRQRNRPAVELSGLQDKVHDRAERWIREEGETEAYDNTPESGAEELQNSMRETATVIPLRSVRERIQQSSEKEGKAVIVTEELPLSDEKGETGSGRFVPELSMLAPPAAYSLKEDKWEQILDSYEQIHPYGDERVYVRLEPKDFIILQAGYQHLVNNSFLLHGFYNYRYVILGKEDDYYLGVPGVYYEREKMVALMFGFEAFECPGGTARAGEFGYYLRKVEI